MIKNTEGNESNSIINFVFATVPRLVLIAWPTLCGFPVKIIFRLKKKTTPIFVLFYCVNGRKLVCNFVSSNCPPDSSTVYDVVAQWFSKTQCGFLSCSFELICLFCFFFIHNAWVLSFNISNWDDFRFRLSWNAFDTQNLSWNPTIKLLLNSTHMWPVLVSILQNYVWQICNNCFLVRFWKKNAVFISNTFHQ